MYARSLQPRLEAALADTPVVLLQGPRQAGKSTLARLLMDHRPAGRYLTLDDGATLAAARLDPAGFIDGLAGPVAIDEIQRAPELFLAIKAAVDRDRRPGRFLLTGSADVLLLPRVAESLVGRMEPHVLWPLSQQELEGSPGGLLAHIWEGGALPPTRGQLTRAELAWRICRGGFPDALARATSERREAWFEGYVTTLLQRDVRELAAIERATELPRLFSLLAARSAGLLNHAELSRTA
ncbi:MAG: ATP-binding protein, partial [Candidatus Sericytochromatia bacterium]|nr:ATP-binding protein [Candidatus Sericytochromatia bacterium]